MALNIRSAIRSGVATVLDQSLYKASHVLIVPVVGIAIVHGRPKAALSKASVPKGVRAHEARLD